MDQKMGGNWLIIFKILFDVYDLKTKKIEEKRRIKLR